MGGLDDLDLVEHHRSRSAVYGDESQGTITRSPISQPYLRSTFPLFDRRGVP